MSKNIHIHVGDTPRLEFITGVSMEYVGHIELRYYKPDGTFGIFEDVVVSDTQRGVVYYQVKSASELNDTGKWRFWIYVVFNDKSPLSFKPVYLDIYEQGKDYVSHPFGGYTDVGEGGDSMPLEAFRIIYDNTISGLTAEDLQAATDELKAKIDALNFQTKLTPYVVGANEIYQTIQSAIYQAVTVDGKNFSNPAVIIVKPGTYTEDVIIYPGINVVALAWEKSYMTRLSGMLIYDTSSGGTSGNKIATWTGIDISSNGSPSTVRFAGLYPQRLHLLNCNITSIGANPAILMTNNSGDAIVVANDVDFENTSTGLAIRVDYGKFSGFKTRSLKSSNAVAMQLNNNSEVESFNNYSNGKIEIKDSVIGLIANPIISNGANNCVVMNSTNTVTFINPVVIGSGSLLDTSDHASNLILKGKTKASEVTYNNNSSGLQSQELQSVVDELKDLIDNHTHA